MTKLVLDPVCVLSAWEQMGGSAFSSDDSAPLVEDPDAFNLDLSGWEAQLKPWSAAPAPPAPSFDPNLFAALFHNPLDMVCFPFLPSCPAAQPGVSNGLCQFGGDGPQVVPLCPSVSAGSVDNNSNLHNNNNNHNHNAGAGTATCPGGTPGLDCGGMLDDATNAGCALSDEDMHMSLHFSDMDSLPSCSPTTSEAGIVPEYDGGSSPMKAHYPSSPQQSKQLCQQAVMCTATSGGGDGGGGGGGGIGAADAPAFPQLPVLPSLGTGAAPPLPTSFFVPVGPQRSPGGGLCMPSTIGCGVGSVSHLVKQEPTGLLATGVETQQQQQQQQQQVVQQQQQQQVQQPFPGIEQQQQQQHQHQQQPAQGVPSPMAPAAPPVPSAATASPVVAPAMAPKQSAAAQQPLSRAVPGGVSAPAPGPQTQPQSGAGAATHIRTRAECLERYRQKKARRLYTKKIRYQLRKINADKRPRIKGRFVKKEELAEFLAAQRGAGAGAARDDGEVEDPYFGMESDEE